MEAHELFIGAWVMRGDIVAEPMIVTEIIPYKDYVCMDFTGLPVAAKFSQINPIPLTSKILEENGWKLISNTQNKLEYSWSTGAIEEYADIHIYVGKDHSNIWRWDFPILNIHLYRGDIELTKFRYVHELQLALKLCGIKKEIVL